MAGDVIRLADKRGQGRRPDEAGKNTAAVRCELFPCGRDRRIITVRVAPIEWIDIQIDEIRRIGSGLC